MLFQSKIIKILLFIIFISSLAVGSSIAYRRFAYEDSQRQVQIALSYKDIELLALRSSQPVDTFLSNLKSQTRLTSVALEEETLQDYVDDGRITVLKGSEIINLYRIGHINRYILSNIYNQIKVKPSSIFIIIDTQEDYERIRDFLQAEFGKDAVKRINVKSGGKHILEIMDDSKDLLQIGLGISSDTLDELINSDITPLIRLKNSTRLNKQIIRLKFSTFIDYFPEALVIFDGTSVLGYPNYLPYTIQKFKNDDLRFGLIEFSNQLGAQTIATEIPSHVLRVHSISHEEMEWMTPSKAIARYLRAAKERGIQVLFIRPFFDTYEVVELIDKNVNMINTIDDLLVQEGLTISGTGFQSPVYEPAKKWEILALSIGLLVATLYLINAFIPVTLTTLISISGVFSAGFYATFLLDAFSSWSLLMSFVTAIVFPPLAIISQFPSEEKTAIMKNRFIFSLFYFMATVGICFIGALFIIGFLSDLEYLKGILRFVGVKLSYFIPIVLIGVYFYLRPHRITSFMYVFKRLYNAPVRTSGLFAFFVCAFLILLLLLRSGNYFHFPSISFESFLREFLENSLSARPRFKEFIVGYPFLFLGFMLVDKKLQRHWLWFFNIIGSFALISLINSFCHIHTSLLISFQRSLLGAGLGFCVGILYFLIYKSLYSLYKRIT